MLRMPATRRAALAALATATLILAAPLGARAQEAYPTRPVRIVVPFPPGGLLDVAARVIGNELQKSLGQPIIVENKPGAGGNIGAGEVAKAAPDGYTLVMGALSTHAVNPHLYKDMPFDPVKDFEPISLVAITPNVLVINSSVPANSVQEFIAYAKANPGKLNFASGSIGSAGHLAGELLKTTAGVDVVHIPYKGAAPAMQDLLGGQVQFMFDNFASANAQIKSGKVKALAVTTTERFGLAPDLPTMREAGVAGYDLYTWIGLLVPAKTPRPIVERLNAEVVKVLKEPAVADAFRAQGAVPSPSTPEAFAAFIKSELAKNAKIVKDGNIRLE